MTTIPSPPAITVSLEWAKQLAKAGWPQDSMFIWIRNEEVVLRSDIVAISLNGSYKSAFDSLFAAPTAEEIIVEICKRTGWTRALLLGSVSNILHHEERDGSLADVLAEIFFNSLKMGTIPPFK